MLLLAAGCVLFGVYNPLPLHGLVEPVLGGKLIESVAGLPRSWYLAGFSVFVLALAVLNHAYGVKRSGRALGAADHIHYAPGLKPVYSWAEAGLLDPYNIGMKLVNGLCIVLFAIDRAIDWIVASFTKSCAALLSRGIRKAHTGEHWMYVLWVVGGAVIVALIFVIP